MQVGIIGAGVQARAAHLPAFTSIEGVTVRAIADLDLEAASKMAEKFGIADVYTDYHEMLADKDIEMVSICTPHHLHRMMAVDAANAGKHVLVEKPMANTLEDADTILEAVNRNNVKLCVVQNYRFFKAVREAKRRIESGMIGETISLHGHSHIFKSFGSRSAPWLLRDDSAGVIEDAGAHIIDIALYLNDFTPIQSVYATGGSFGGQLDIDLIMECQIVLEFDNLSTVMLDISALGGSKEIAAYVQGTGGTLKLDIRSDHICESHQYSTPLDDVVDLLSKLKGIGKGIMNGSYFLGAKSNYITLIRDFITSIEKDTDSPVTADQGRTIALVIEASMKSIKEGRRVMIRDGKII